MYICRKLALVFVIYAQTAVMPCFMMLPHKSGVKMFNYIKHKKKSAWILEENVLKRRKNTLLMLIWLTFGGIFFLLKFQERVNRGGKVRFIIYICNLEKAENEKTNNLSAFCHTWQCEGCVIEYMSTNMGNIAHTVRGCCRKGVLRAFFVKVALRDRCGDSFKLTCARAHV